MEVNVFTRRFGHDDCYTIKKTDKGWYIENEYYNGDCDTFGKPTLFDSLNHDSVNYPEALGDYLDYLWRESSYKDNDWIQEKLNELFEWVKEVEESTLKTPFWKVYN